MKKPRVIAMSNHKGGVAKTVTTINIGAELAAAGRRVLMVDMDSQGQLAGALNLPPEAMEHTLYSVLTAKPSHTLSEVIHPLSDNLHIVPSDITTADLELELASMMRREDRLKMALRTVQDEYDAILIDCPPSPGLLTVNAFSAADEVLAIMRCEFPSLLALVQLFTSIAEAQAMINPDLEVIGILPTVLDRREKHGLEVLERVAVEFDTTRILDPIPKDVAASDAFAAGIPLIDFRPRSRARLAYQALTKELFSL